MPTAAASLISCPARARLRDGGPIAAQADPSLRGVLALILVPTRELCEQVRDQLRTLCFYCSRIVSSVMLTADVPMETQRCVRLWANPNLAPVQRVTATMAKATQPLVRPI